MNGPCDTPGCLNPAEVHYGLEEFYCSGCHKENQATNERLEREYQEFLDGGDCTGHLIAAENRPSN